VHQDKERAQKEELCPYQHIFIYAHIYIHTYIQERLLWLMFCADVLLGCTNTPPDRPWIIFTAGAMGAGKSHTVKMLQAFGCCSLTHMSKVDPDTVKYQLPEMVHYIQKNPGPKPDKNIIYAGHATHNESAFIQEIIVREMLEESKSMIIGVYMYVYIDIDRWMYRYIDTCMYVYVLDTFRR